MQNHLIPHFEIKHPFLELLKDISFEKNTDLDLLINFLRKERYLFSKLQTGSLKFCS